MRAGKNASGGGRKPKLTAKLGSLSEPSSNERPGSADSHASSNSSPLDGRRAARASEPAGLFGRLSSPQNRRTNKLSLSREDDRSRTPSPLARQSSRLGTPERIGFFMKEAMRSFSSSALSLLEEEETEEEKQEKQAEASRKVRETLHALKKKNKALESMRERAFLNLGTTEHPAAGKERGLLRLQRKTGILEVRVRIQIKEMLLEEQEEAYFKDIHATVNTVKFEAFFGLLILLNAICIGWDTFYLPDESRPVILVLSEHFFTLMFLIEFILRVMAYTWFWFFSFVNLFDTFLIWGPGVLLTWILLPAGLSMHAYRRFAALRILRLGRLCKVVRIMKPFRELWMLVQGVMSCATLLIWVIVIGGMVHFTFAVFILELVAKSDSFKDDETVQQYFGTTMQGMFSLFQLMTFDSWSGIVRPIVEKAPETVLIFGLFMGVAGIVLINLMTAIVVRNAYDAGEGDLEAVLTAKLQENKKVSKELLETFQDLDEDGSGALSQEEFNDCLDDYLFVRKMKLLDIDLEELPDFFEILDDGDGQVDQTEFITGMMKMQGSAMNSDVLKATSKIKVENKHFSRLSDTFVRDAMETYTRIEGDMDNLHTGMNDIMQLTAEVMLKLDELGIRKILKSSMKDIPFVDEPDIQDLAKADKRHAAAQRRGIELVVEDDIEDLLPPEAKLEKTVPSSWIIREGRSHADKNPGKALLQRDPSLRERIKNNSATARKAKQVTDDTAVTVSRELSHKWSFMHIPLTEFSTLRTVASEPDGRLVPETKMTPLVNSMSDVLLSAVDTSPGDKYRQAWAASPTSISPSEALESVQPTLQSQVSEISLTPAEQRGDEASRKALQHPHAVPADTLF